MDFVIMDNAAIKRALGRMAHEILEENQGSHGLVVIGIRNRGWPVAKRLAFMMSQIEDVVVPCGSIDITQTRDDLVGEPPVSETDIPFSIDGMRVILVDEVVHTGRTVRAALDALMRLGRPSKVELATLLDRQGRELPIQPDYIGKRVDMTDEDRINVTVTDTGESDQAVIHTEDE